MISPIAEVPNARSSGSTASRHARTDVHWATLCVVATTVGSEQAAHALAQSLVQQRAAACVQVEPVTSHFEWQQQLRAEPEWRLTCKTLPDVLQRLTALIRAVHEYEVPQITMRTERCLDDYASWVKAQVSLKAPAPDHLSQAA
ncbi:divalent-cation tolerance protein CutA [Comamonas composti]|uniref:divalent-cation tolerance protein CutA n=1 Tax=Comamonas composti TaxID=408558 RepID=UPI0006850FBD|nr:divalent-cation tolerance protein CutA [Comamonas composti]